MPGRGNDALEVVFQRADGSLRCIAPVRVPEHETAFAMTVHQAQGSEFDAVLLVLPESDNQVVTRELVYTAITRARKSVAICASAEVFVTGVARRVVRSAGLATRLWGAPESR